MATDLRRTGIDVISQMPWGTHFCLFYENQDDLLNVVVPYLKAGLEDNEFCVWVVADPLTEEDAWRALSQAVPAFEHHRSRQSIELLPAHDWYLNVGHFELERVTSAWNRKLTQALARGYAGMRVSGDTLWLEKKTWKSFLDYENQLDRSITDQLMTILCTYPLTSSSAAEILDVARSHQFTLARRGGAWEVIETPELKQAKAEIKSLNEQLERRVVERTVQLAASNEQLKLELIERKQAEDLLHAREQEFRVIVENAPDQIIRYDKEFRRTYVNPAVTQAYGLPREAFIGKPVGSVVDDAGLKPDKDEVAAIRQRIKSVFDTGQATEYEVTFPSPGGRRTYWTRMYPEFDPNGVVINVLSISREITERKQTEESIRKSEQVLREAESLGHTGSWEQNLVTGEIFNTEENLHLFFGDGHSKGADFEDYAEVVHPDDREYVMQRRVQLLAEGGPRDIEYRVVWPDGSVHVIFGRATVVYDELGQALRVYGTNVDITERKQAEEALRRSESNFRILADKSLEGIQLYQGGKSVYANAAMTALLGYTREELRGMSMEEHIALVHPLDRAITAERALRHQAGHEVSASLEVRILTKAGATRWVQGFTNEIEYNGQPAILSTAIDITERKQAEEEIRRHAARMEALARISQVLAEVGLDIQAVFEAIVRHTAELIGDTCGIRLLSSDEQWLQSAAFHNPNPEVKALMRLLHPTTPTSADHSWLTPVLRTGQPLLIPIIDQEQLRQSVQPEYLPFFEQVGLHSMLIVPLRVKGRVIGTLGLSRDQPGHPYTPDDQVLLQDLADRASLTIQNAQLFEQVQGAHQRLQVLSSRLVEVQESERKRLARELHDEFGQSLTALKMDLAWLHDHLPPRTKGLRAKVDSALDLTNETIQLTQRLASQLRPRMLDDLGLAAALEWYVNEWSKRTHIKTKVTLPEEEWELDPSLNTGLYRVCQEALTNVVRHAGASKVEVSLAREGDEVILTVSDNGRGMDGGKIIAPESLGLLGMKERVEQIGGRLEVQSEAGKGTTVVARVPVSQSSSPRPSHHPPKERRQAGKKSKGRGSDRKKS